MNKMKLVYVRPTRIVKEGNNEKVEDLDELTSEEMQKVIGLAERVGYTSGNVSRLEGSSEEIEELERIKLNDPNGEGYHRDYLARFGVA